MPRNLAPHDKQLPKESSDFDLINLMWRDVTRGVAEDPNCLVACHTTGILKMLQGMSEELEVIERALEQYLETKRQFFPRFYFISNDILLEILGCSKNPPEVGRYFLHFRIFLSGSAFLSVRLFI